MVRSPPRSRDYDRGYARGSKGREPDRRYDDRSGGYSRHHDDRRRDRSRDRHDDRGPRRERSTERPRERKRSRDGDRYGGDPRDRKRSRRDEYSPRRRGSGDHGSGRLNAREGESSRPSTADSTKKRYDPEEEERQAKLAEEEAKKAKLAKVEAWKQKLLSKQGQGAASPAAESKSPEASQPTTGAPSPADPGTPGKATPAPYAGKFDPKAISRRAAAALERSKANSALGGDVVIPKSAQQPSNGVTKLADHSKPSMGASKTARPAQKISGFGLSKAAEKQDKSNTAGKGAASHLGDEEEAHVKLEKLPDMPMNDIKDAALANDDEAQEEGDAIRSDEEDEEKLREAALRRSELAQAEQQDVGMDDDDKTVKADDQDDEDAKMEDGADEDEVDPLDAFMTNLQPTATNSLQNLAIGRRNQTQVFDNEDEAGNYEAVGDGGDDLLALAAKRKKKEMPNINHGTVQYEPFRKNFYAESVELADMTPEEVDELRLQLENIKCRGLEAPKPILKWSQGGFGAQILDVIREQKFEKPTPIQSQALPAIMSGRDVIGIAKTGSGKTLAFILPMFRHIKDQRPVENLEGPIGLILAPTRELVTQIHRDCKPYLKALGLRAVAAYGGAPIKDQIAELKRGAEIVVATAGRFIDLLAANAGRVTNLRRVTYIVMDEADRMFDMGFEPQITKILNNIRPNRQTVLFSATFPKGMEALARKALTKPLEIVVGGRSTVPPEITQIIEVREERSKFKRLLELLGDLHDKDEDARSLIFVERQETADLLLKQVMSKGYPILAVHGGREQIDRDQAISDFKAGVAPIMVATSVAARGLDVKQLKLVVNYDSPNHPEDYVHRAGRTGRAGNTGTAVTFITPDQDRFATFLIKALTDSKQEAPEELKKLAEEHQEKVKAGQAKKIGSGFGGKGIDHIEAVRDAERARERKQYKTGDEPAEEEETEKSGKEKKVEDMLAKANGTVKDRESAVAVAAAKDDNVLPLRLKQALSNAMNVTKAVTPPPQTKPPPKNDPLAKVREAAANIGNRLGRSGGTKAGVPLDNRGPDAGAYHAILEINDFPQKARWGVTNRTNVAKVLENTGTSITTKGNFYAAGKEPGEGEQPKLYILVEADTEGQVKKAMEELTTLLREGTIAEMNSQSRAAPSGRYNVL